MSPDATAHLTRVSGGDSAAIAELMPLVYDELRQIAAAHLAQEQAGHTLQPTALVHEAYLKLVNQSRAQWKDRAHFLAIASGVIRRILIDHARGRRAQKRGSDKRMTLGSIQDLADPARNVDLLEIGDALDRLAQLDARQAKDRGIAVLRRTRRPRNRRGPGRIDTNRGAGLAVRAGLAGTGA
jgi:RNA polymerase sigma factor (TIGR02999 family)